MYKLYLEHVNYLYSKGTPFEQRALDDVTLGIRENCITGIIGHTGSGKSTMMQLFNGLATPTEGKIFLDGLDIHTNIKDAMNDPHAFPALAGLKKGERKRALRQELIRLRQTLCFRVGLVMQYPEYQLFEETVYKDIAYGPKNMGLAEAEIDARVREAARFTGVDESWFEKSPFDLSGGQKRRVALAGVIAMRPEVLILDEPAAGLDPRGRDSIFEYIRSYQSTTHSTVLIVSHSMEDMARFCDDVVVMADAKVIMHGACDEVFSKVEQLSDIGLDIPQITTLMRLLQDSGIELPKNIYTVEAAVNAIAALLGADGKGERT